MWYRVFGANGREPEPTALLEYLHAAGFKVTGHFGGDDEGWFRASILLAPAGPIQVERYQAAEGIRPELNAWAAWLETAEDNPNHGRLMRHMIGTTQLITVRPPPGDATAPLREVCTAICRFLARETDGVYQADGLGFFDRDGLLLVPET
jgi:hypothetical protein